MSASLSGDFNLQAFTDLGDPLIGGRLYTYNFGTTTHKTAYTDHAGTIPHTYTNDGQGGQYIALNARGELSAPLYLVGGSYDLSLKRADGSTLWTRRADPVWDIVNDLSGSGGASAVGFGPVTVAEKLSESISVKDKGAVGGGANDTTPVNVAVADAGNKGTVVLPQGQYRVDAAPVNKFGVEFEGPGSIVKAITGGLQQLNTYADKHKIVFGREYLAAFHNLLISQHSAPTRKPIMVFSGDSTTAGDGVSADYQIPALLKLAGEAVGLQTPYGLTSVNRGQSGQQTAQWVSTHLAGDLSANPDLLVVRWGINDPGWLKSGAPAPADAGQSYANRRDVNDYITSLRAGLTTIRASRNVASLSIILMTPNSTSDTPNGRDEQWYEQIVPAIKQAARDFQCCFIDTYAFLKDSRGAAGVWMDNPYADGRAIHPLNVMNTWIAGLMADVIFPEGLRRKIGRANMRVVGGAEDLGDAARLPSTYSHGVTVSRAAAGTGFPLDGILITTRSQDDIVIQTNYPYEAGVNAKRSAYRMGRAATLGPHAPGWESWQMVGDTTSSVTPATGYALPGSGGMRTLASGSVVTADGYITMNTPAVIAANTVVASVSAGFSPQREPFYGQATVWNGSVFSGVRVIVAATGEVRTLEATPISVTRLWLNASWTTTP